MLRCAHDEVLPQRTMQDVWSPYLHPGDSVRVLPVGSAAHAAEERNRGGAEGASAYRSLARSRESESLPAACEGGLFI